jgi:hypothetical protein
MVCDKTLLHTITQCVKVPDEHTLTTIHERKLNRDLFHVPLPLYIQYVQQHLVESFREFTNAVKIPIHVLPGRFINYISERQQWYSEVERAMKHKGLNDDVVGKLRRLFE